MRGLEHNDRHRNWLNAHHGNHNRRHERRLDVDHLDRDHHGE
jgi:hypothetical protein